MANLITSFLDVVDYIRKAVELLAIITSAVMVVVIMVNQFGLLITKILKPYGLKNFNRFLVLVMCRKTPRKKRAFLEFAILRTQGYYQNAKQWRQIINEFKTFYEEDNSKLIYSIDNCTELINENLSDLIGSYFEYLKNEKVKKAFGIHEESLEFVISIKIVEAYLTPTCLISGLLSKYEENWKEFIKAYVSTAYMSDMDMDNDNCTMTEELYYTFAWLLWGPSYEIDYNHAWGGLAQIMYGDESNSIPVVINEGRIPELESLLRTSDEKRYGELFCIYIKLCEKNDYYRNIRKRINPTYEYFYNKAITKTLSFTAQLNDFETYCNYKAKKYYCTAYVWVLFEIENEDCILFQPEKSVAFFEHANIADIGTYSFLVEALINKSIYHFEQVYADKKYEKRKYRFVCAMNKSIEERVKERYAELAPELRDKIIMDSKHAPSNVFSAYDDFFVESDDYLFEEVSYHNKESIVDLGIFYTDIYMESFSDDNERESFDHLLYYLRQGDNHEQYRYHIVLLKDRENHIIAGGICDYFKKRNSGVIEFIAVKSNLQSSGIGTIIYKQIIKVLEKDAHLYLKRNLDYVFCEIDAPEYSKASVKKYLFFWSKQNFKRISFQYVQPRLSDFQENVMGLWFTVTKRNGYLEDEIDGRIVLDIVHEYQKYAMQIDDPDSNDEYCKMKEEILEKGKLKTLNIL